jgi:hypothetical protein
MQVNDSVSRIFFYSNKSSGKKNISNFTIFTTFATGKFYIPKPTWPFFTIPYQPLNLCRWPWRGSTTVKHVSRRSSYTAIRRKSPRKTRQTSIIIRCLVPYNTCYLVLVFRLIQFQIMFHTADVTPTPIIMPSPKSGGFKIGYTWTP